MDPKLVTPWILAAFVVLMMYRRIRRNFGRQRVSEGRLKFRVVLLSVVGALILFASAFHPIVLAALLGGAVAGVALALVGLRHTQFEATSEGRFYIPHTYTGLVVTALFIGRVGYRLLVNYQQMQAGAQADQNPFASLQRNPLTAVVFGLLIGYYIYFSLSVLRRSRLLVLPATAVSTPATSVAPPT
jgi:hypothetical protein